VSSDHLNAASCEGGDQLPIRRLLKKSMDAAPDDFADIVNCAASSSIELSISFGTLRK
jgi:hypothetical protein